MLGCWSRAATRISRRNRSAPTVEPRSGLSSLKATGIAAPVGGGEEYGGHAAAAELALDGVGAREGGLEVLEEVWFHGNETVTARDAHCKRLK